MDIEEEIRALQLDSPGEENSTGATDRERAQGDDVDSTPNEDGTENNKRHRNIVFIGHVDAGKSTIAGQICILSGQVDHRMLHRRVADILDTNEEERVRGKTIEVGKAHFETETTRFTILDAPGHTNYIPNMISGTSQADIGVLVISARRGEFETGYERGGQTREHVQLAKTYGVSKLLVVVNKMDEPTVNWSKQRYDEIESKMVPFLKTSGYNVKKDVAFLPISGIIGVNINTRMDKSICSWWNGPCLFEVLDHIEIPLQDPSGPFRMPIIEKSKEMAPIVVMGKVEAGSVTEGDSLLVMPNKTRVKVIGVYIDKNDVKRAVPGENLGVRLSGIEYEDISAGFVLSSISNPIAGVTEFIAQLQIVELDNAIFCAGCQFVLHIHAVVEECEITELIAQVDPQTRKPMKKKPVFVKKGAIINCRIQVNSVICIEPYSEFPQLGRFTLRTAGKTIARGVVTQLSTGSA